MVANRRKRPQMVANGHKRSQMVASRRKRSQMVANDCKWSQTKYALELNAYWPAPATLAQHLTYIGSVSVCNRRRTSYYSQQTQNICITFVQRRPNVFDALYKCYTNVLCLLGWTQPSKHEALNQCWFDAGPASQTVGQHCTSICSGRVCWVCRQAPKRNNKFRLIHIVSTVHRSHLITLITKAIDTTSISYQPLWLCCWRGDISVVCPQKTRPF